jgi:hypothetical protein
MIWLKTAGRRFSADINFVSAGKRRDFCRLCSQAQGRAPPPQVAELRAKTTLFARGTLGQAWMPGSSVSY